MEHRLHPSQRRRKHSRPLLGGASAAVLALALPFALHAQLKLNADLLLRAEHVTGFERARVWLRPGFEDTPNTWLRFGARGSFALGTDRNRESILRFDNFHSNDVSLDRLYVAVEKDRLDLEAGKFAMPFRVSEMLWDQDIQPSGLALAWRGYGWALRGGVFHRSHIHHDRSTIAGGQVSFTRGLAEADAGFMVFNALDQFQPGMERQNRARLVDGRLRYASQFRLAHARSRVVYRRFAVESTYVQNFGASEQRRAVEAMAQAGKVERPGDWRLSCTYQRVEREAVVAAFTSDDWWFHSDHRGSRVSAAYSFLPHTFVQFSAVVQKRASDGATVKRFQLDFAAQF